MPRCRRVSPGGFIALYLVNMLLQGTLPTSGRGWRRSTSMQGGLCTKGCRIKKEGSLRDIT